MYTVATCPLCDRDYRVQPWPRPGVLKFSRVVFDLPCCHRKFSILALELDIFQSSPDWFPETAQIVEIKPPQAQFDTNKYHHET